MIAVVGGGVSGLAVGYHLDRRGVDVRVLEARSVPGGLIRSVRCGEHVLDLGPQRLRLTAPVRAMVEALGLADELVAAPDLPLHVHVDGRLRRVPLDLTTALTTDLVSWRDRGRALVEPFTPGLGPDETAADFFIRKFGRRNYQRVIAPLYGDLYGSDPADMPGRHALARSLRTLGIEGSLLRAMLRAFRARRAVPAASFRDGMQAFTDAMARALGDRLRLATSVAEARESGGRLRLRGDRLDLLADHVILACPAGPAARILRHVAPDAAASLAALRYNPLAVVHLRSDADLRTMGFQVPFETGLATRGVTANHAMFGQVGLYTAFLGGAARVDVPARSDAEIGAIAAGEFEALTGDPARPLHVYRTRMPAWDRSWAALDRLDLPKGVSVCASWWDRPGVTGRLVEAARLAERLAERRTPPRDRH